MKKIFDGILDNVKEMKRYRAGKSIDEVKEEFGLEKVVKLASNENSLGPAIQVIDTIQSEAKSVCLYPDSESRELKTALAEKYQLDEKRIFLGNGSDEILDLLMTLILNPGDEVIQGDPAFIKYELAVKSRGGSSVKVPLDDKHRHNLEAMEAEITDQTKVICICNPNNPTGTMLKKEEIESFLDSVSDEILVIIDQAYQEYITAEDPFDGLELLEKHPNLMLMRSFSKAYGLAGMRIGYSFADPELVDYLNRIRGPFNVNRLAQKAAVTALESESHLEICQNLNEKEKKFLYQKFEGLELDYIESEANFIMVDTEMPADEVFKKLQKRGVIIRPGSQFGMDSWIRVTIGTRADNEYFIRNLKKVLAEGND
ncbi:MAG: histidinol-phosphate transaminase [Halanaerobium sp.]